MMRALLGAAIFDGHATHHGHALLLEGGRVAALLPEAALPAGAEVSRLEGGLLAPGFVDLQVNGGGGVLFNETPTPDGIATIVAAHAEQGTTALLPTLITDTPDLTRRAIAAVRACALPGCLGLHLEGPHLDPRRKGAHDPALIRPMGAADLAALCGTGLPRLLVTVAPEAATPAQITALAAAGVLVSLGHSDAGRETVLAAEAAGARLVTHLFNAMSPLGSREPGMVGTALERPGLHCGIIADGFHVHPAMLALAARLKGDGLFLVSDAMPTLGVAGDHFTLGGRAVTRRGGRLTLADGTLAGADLSLAGAVRVMVRQAGLPLEQALRMASLLPARLLGLESHGHLRPGARADIVLLDDALAVRGVWTGGAAVSPAAG
ncbi:N-acetylglucosamine-6-phosphate deacetylase [Roseomonas haemaphysalidis]|uniref:N-acetylglucosamine-6-phosphate deacetylase n=1 Tax=Roseomonas haemaphysalidis TaxID=2768162 RepID=A0ABS3KMY5_9PROT|nr:N-acetylglucosamine-6-phosphate deacetylase [Roseomonas haemaphysalidis]MBO1078810.1 N-acetylglucosamine-6-phosphate deacetylase [Roseomonas haemaphysalidis]